MAHSREELRGKSLDELHQMANEMGIDGQEEMDQNELMNALSDEGGGAMRDDNDMM